MSCTHESASGVDQTPVTDEAKVWRCDSCGFTYRSLTHQAHDRYGGTITKWVAVEPCSTCGGTGWERP
jgi:rubredoxin